MARKARCKPNWPISVEVVPYRAPREPGHPDTPLLDTDMLKEIGDRVCVARVAFTDADDARAACFVSIQLVRQGLMVRIEQDQTDYSDIKNGSRIVNREFLMRFYPKPK